MVVSAVLLFLQLVALLCLGLPSVAVETDTAAPVVEITIPCYNEESRFPMQEYVEFVARTQKSTSYEVRFLFVNDGSTDNTLNLLQQLTSRFPQRFRVLDLADNVGKAEAVRRGMLESLKTSASTAPDKFTSHAPDFVGFWDGDLATPLDEIGNFLQVFTHQDNIEMVLGSRVALLGRNISRQVQLYHTFSTFTVSEIFFVKVDNVYNVANGWIALPALPRTDIRNRSFLDTGLARVRYSVRRKTVPRF